MESVTREGGQWESETSHLLSHPSKATTAQAGSEDDFNTRTISSMDRPDINIYSYKRSICFKLIIITIPMFVMVIISITFFTGVAIYSIYLQDSYLGIASDVIQCADHHWSQAFSDMILEQNATDAINDNRQGLDIDVFSLNWNDVVLHDLIDDHDDFELVLTTSGANRFILPYNYYDRPWYLWPESTISMDYDIIFTEAPTEARAFLYKGEKAINNFFANTQSLPSYEEQVDLMATKSKNMFWTVKTNDYYFVAVEIKGEKDTIFKANISFTVLYVDIDDYSWLPTVSKKLVGIGDGLELGWSRSSNLTLCYLHPQENRLYSNSIHINVFYKPSIALPATVAPIFVVVFAYVVVLVIMCVYIKCHRRVHHKRYPGIN